MGQIIAGKWRDEEHDTKAADGRFVRKESAFRNRVTADGSSGFPAESGRYHLYVSLACPWAHRTLIFRALKGLEDTISLSVVDPYMGEHGWSFSDGPDCIPDPLYGARYLYEIYTRANPTYTGRVTVPVLWDKKRATIVSNESAEIIRMFNSEFNAVGNAGIDFSPKELRGEIDAINDFVYPNINNGVYRCGFATTQEAYEEAFAALFSALDQIETRLGREPYLVGNRLTEADWRLFTTLVRFDAVYFGHFKCNLRRIADYPHLSRYLRQLYQIPGVAGTVNLTHIKRHYYESHRSINPTGIVPVGPALEFTKPQREGEQL
ncbi:MAG: glutathione S-transferase family protein [Candidatus Binatia bacterium]